MLTFQIGACLDDPLAEEKVHELGECSNRLFNNSFITQTVRVAAFKLLLLDLQFKHETAKLKFYLEGNGITDNALAVLARPKQFIGLTHELGLRITLHNFNYYLNSLISDFQVSVKLNRVAADEPATDFPNILAPE